MTYGTTSTSIRHTSVEKLKFILERLKRVINLLETRFLWTWDYGSEMDIVREVTHGAV